MQSTHYHSEFRRVRRGFTLTEIAIVLGIIGLILGAIWVAASAVYSNLRLSRSQQELLQIAQAVRSMYATQTTIAAAAGVDQTASLAPAGVFPSDAAIFAGGAWTVNGPWSGSTISVWSATNAVAGDSFVVEFVNIPNNACINLLPSVTGAGRDPGLTYANGNATGAAITPGNIAASPVAIPVNSAAAATACGNAGGGKSTAAFGFRLK